VLGQNKKVAMKCAAIQKVHKNILETTWGWY